MKLTTAFVFASLAGNAFAEQLHVDVPSAKAPGTAVVRITGDPGRPYQLFYSQVEDMYELPDGNFLFIDPSAQIAAGVDISGVLDASGEALYTFPVKARQAGSKLSFQAISPDPFMQLSNVARATFQKGNTFAFSAGEGGSPSFLGDVFPMANGRLLSVGGSGQMIEQYEPCLQQMEAIGWIDNAYPHSARAMLANGKVLIAGGLAADGSAVADAFLFDPKFGDLVSVGPMLAPRAGAAAVLLGDGRVLLIGGLSSSSLADTQAFAAGIQSSTEIFDPVLFSFSAGPAMAEGRAFASATVLADGKVLVAGGLSPGGNQACVSHDACVVDMGLGAVGSLLAMPSARMFHTATLLADGSVLLVGGLKAQAPKKGGLFGAPLVPTLVSAVYSPATGEIVAGPKLLTRRALHTASIVGPKVLVAGGVGSPIGLAALLAAEMPSEARKSSELVEVGMSTKAGGLRIGRVGAGAAVSAMDGRVIVIGGGPAKASLYQPQ